MPLHDINAAKPNPIFAIESRPSALTGLAWYAMLVYKEHSFEELLLPEWASLDEVGQALATQPVFERLRAQLAPILIAEDRGELQVDDKGHATGEGEGRVRAPSGPTITIPGERPEGGRPRLTDVSRISDR